MAFQGFTARTLWLLVSALFGMMLFLSSSVSPVVSAADVKYTREAGHAVWASYLVFHNEQRERAKNGDCSDITYVIYRQRNGFGDDIGAMMGVLKQAYRLKAVYVVDGWLAEYLHPIMGDSFHYDKLMAEGAICPQSKENNVRHHIIAGHVSTGSDILTKPDVQDPTIIERHMPALGKLLISPRPDLGDKISEMQKEAGLFGKLVVALQIRTGVVDKYGSPKFLGGSREESQENADIFFDCAVGLLGELDPEVVNLDEDVRFFVASDDHEVIKRAKAHPVIGNRVVSFDGMVIHSVQASAEERNAETALKLFADFFTLADANVLFKTSSSLFGSQANRISEAARLVYTVNNPHCGEEGHGRCAGHFPVPDNLGVWLQKPDSHRTRRLISFGAAPLPETCSNYTVLDGVYGARSRTKTIGEPPVDSKWYKARSLFKTPTWPKQAEELVAARAAAKSEL